ncbi:MAG: FtsX-like permease family protein [Bacteroidales bacterium]|nr:FtsX-like permease family protein [Bacteroidales bacterium]
MYLHYLSIGFRSIKKHWFLITLNVISYGIGIAACLILLQNIFYEMSFDKYNSKNDNIYRVQLDHFYSDEYQNSTAISFYPLGDELKNQYSEVEEIARMRKFRNTIVRNDDKVFFEKNVYMIDSSFFHFFSFDIIEGSIENLDIYNFIISESIAKKYFGDTDPIGRELEVWGDLFEVKGVYKDMPENSHFQSDILIISPTNTRMSNNWAHYSFYTYILLKQGVDPKQFEVKLESFNKEFSNLSDEQSSVDYSWKIKLQKLTDIHLRSDIEFEHEVNANIENVYLLIVIAIMIITLSLLNFVNLSNSINNDRMNEVCIRKILGANRSKIIHQYIIQSLIINIISFLIAFILIFIFPQLFSQVININNWNLIFEEPIFYYISFAILLVTFVFSGLLPAFAFSSFNPLQFLKGLYFTDSRKRRLGQFVLIGQFVISIILIMGAVIVNRQLSYSITEDKGFNESGIEVVQMTYTNYAQNILLLERMKSELEAYSLIENVSYSQDIPGNQYNSDASIRFVDNPVDASEFCYIQTISPSFFETYGIELLEGRTFSEERKSDSNSVILNETLVRELDITNLNDALGKYVVLPFLGGDYITCKIIGIVKDYHQESLRNKIQPCVFTQFRNEGYCLYTSIKTNFQNENDKRSVINLIEKKWNEAFPKIPFNLTSVKDAYNKQYKADLQYGVIVEILTFLAIMIASMGFLGLASYDANKMLFEVGIRKVHGAQTRNILQLFINKYLKILGIALIISLPVGYFIAAHWLENFAYKINIGILFFIYPILIIISLVAITVSYHIIRTSLVKPVTILKDN